MSESKKSSLTKKLNTQAKVTKVSSKSNKTNTSNSSKSNQKYKYTFIMFLRPQQQVLWPTTDQ